MLEIEEEPQKLGQGKKNNLTSQTLCSLCCKRKIIIMTISDRTVRDQILVWQHDRSEHFQIALSYAWVQAVVDTGTHM